MKFLKTTLLLVILATAFTACSPYATTGVSVGTGFYGPRPYYRPYAYRPYYRPPVVVVPQRRVFVRPHPGYRGGYNRYGTNNGYSRGYRRGRGGRW